MHNPMCAKFLYVWVVHGYCHSDSAWFCVCESFVLYIYTLRQFLFTIDATVKEDFKMSVENAMRNVNNWSMIRA